MDQPDVIPEVRAVLQKLVAIQGLVNALLVEVGNLYRALELAEAGQGTLFDADRR